MDSTQLHKWPRIYYATCEVKSSIREMYQSRVHCWKRGSFTTQHNDTTQSHRNGSSPTRHVESLCQIVVS